MQLSKRLSAVASLVTEGSRLADIGTDHGYVPIYLTQKGILSSAMAMDVNKGPLQRAREHISEHGLEDKITTRLSNGLKELVPGEADSVLIAGMGGYLIIRILEEGRKHRPFVKEWILQPQSDLEAVRRYLAKEGLSITAELMVEEEGKYYPMMRVVPGEPYELEEKEYLFGRFLFKEKNPVLYEWLTKEEQKLIKVTESLGTQTSETALERKEELKRYLTLVQEVLTEYEMR